MDNSFSERQAALQSQKVNYAGHYIVYTKQYGTDCVTAYIADVKTGQDVSGIGTWYKNNKQTPQFFIEYHPNSGLLVVSGIENNSNIPTAQIYWAINDGHPSKLSYYDFYQIEHNQANFQKYCQDLNTGKQFKGTSDFLCTYPNKTIKDIYNKLTHNLYNGRLLHQLAPKIGKTKGYNFKNDGDVTAITYDWKSQNNLKINIHQFSIGQIIYTITQKPNKVTVRIHTEKRDTKLLDNNLPFFQN